MDASHYPLVRRQKQNQKGPQLIWITPLRALAKDTERQFKQSLAEFGLEVQVGRRTGDVSSSVRKKQEQSMPQVLITTPRVYMCLWLKKNMNVILNISIA